MVFVWSHLAKVDPLFTLSQVALNDAIRVVAFAPIVGVLIEVPVKLSVVYIVNRSRSGYVAAAMA